MRAIHALSAFALLAAAASAPGETVHRYSASDAPAAENWTPVEQFRRGGYDDEFLMGAIVDADVDEDGNLYLLDSQLSEVHIFLPSGEWLRSIGREGEGPGEFRRAQSMLLLGDHVAVMQRFPGRIVLLSKQGDPMGDLTVEGVEGFGGVTAAEIAGDAVVMARRGGSRDGDRFEFHSTLAVYDRDGNELAPIESLSTEFNRNDRTWREGARREHIRAIWDVLADGTVAVGSDPDRYRIAFHALDGSLLHAVEVDRPLRPRSEEELEDLRGRMVFRGRGRGGNPPKVELRENHFVFADMVQGPDGRLWVLTADGARPDEDGVLAVYDAFDADGSWVRRVRVRAPGDALEDGIFFHDGGMVVVHGYQDALRAAFGGGGGDDDEDADFDAEPLEVVLYRFEVGAGR